LLDIEVSDSTTPKADVDEALLSQGWTYDSTDPTVPLAAAVLPGCRVFQIVPQSIPNFVVVVATFTSENFNDQGMHDSGVNPGRITIPAGQGGRYLLQASIAIAANASGQRATSIRLNGVTTLAIENENALTGGMFGTITTVDTIEDLAAGDYVEALTIQTSGLTLDTIVGRENTFFAVQRIK
jgi:hypothetical protein